MSLFGPLFSRWRAQFIRQQFPDLLQTTLASVWRSCRSIRAATRSCINCSTRSSRGSAPRYEIIDQKRKDAIIEKVRRFDHVIIDDVQHDSGSPAVMLKQKTATKQMWLYSNMDVGRRSS